MSPGNTVASLMLCWYYDSLQASQVPPAMCRLQSVKTKEELARLVTTGETASQLIFSIDVVPPETRKSFGRPYFKQKT